jgi:Kef-type K+ transport system membrane component KefB
MSETLQLFVCLVVIVVGAKLSGYLSARLGQPMVVGEILFGLLLGPTVLNFLGWGIFPHWKIGEDTLRGLELAGVSAAVIEATEHGLMGETVHLLAEVGVVLLMFLAGLETDLVGMRRVGLAATSAAIGGVIMPFLGGWALSSAVGLSTGEAIFIGTILTATSVSISAQTLIELGRLRSREGMTILGAAVIDDVIGILMLSVVVAVFSTSGSAAAAPVWLLAVKMIAFFVIALLLAPVARWFVGRFSGLPVSEPLLAAALVAALLYAVGAEVIGGVAAITGSYLAGVILGQISLKHQLEEKTRTLVYALFVPIFFVDIGLRANLIEAFRGPLWLYGIGIVLIAVVGKVIGSGLGALLMRFSPQESLRVGVGMVSRGEVGLIVAGIGVQRGVINQDLFSIMVLMVVVSTLVTPVLLRLTFPKASPEPEVVPSSG